jgi:hypothetical protein
MRASYKCELEGDDLLLITDLDQGRSVTNDAENVIADLARTYDLTARRVIYRDTMGVWDGLAVNRGKFTGFVAIDARTRDDAVQRARAMTKWP